MATITPSDLLIFCNGELSKHVKFDFYKYEGSQGNMYFADYVTIQKSESTIWDDVKNVKPAPTRYTVGQALKIICHREGMVVAKSGEDKRGNNELIDFYCEKAITTYIQAALDEKIANEII